MVSGICHMDNLFVSLLPTDFSIRAEGFARCTTEGGPIMRDIAAVGTRKTNHEL